MRITGNEKNWVLKIDAGSSTRVAKVVLTTQCNMRCPYCYVKHGSSFMTLEQLNEVLEWHPTDLYLYGGEPTLHPNLISMLDAARGIPTVIQSNGVKADLLLEAADHGARISLSYHGKMLHPMLKLAKELSSKGALESVECMVSTETSLKDYRLFSAMLGDLAVPQVLIGSKIKLASFNNIIMQEGLESRGCLCASGTVMQVFTPNGVYRCDQYMLAGDHSLGGPCGVGRCYDSWCPKRLSEQ